MEFNVDLLDLEPTQVVNHPLPENEEAAIQALLENGGINKAGSLFRYCPTLPTKKMMCMLLVVVMVGMVMMLMMMNIVSTMPWEYCPVAYMTWCSGCWIRESVVVMVVGVVVRLTSRGGRCDWVGCMTGYSRL